MLQITQKKLEPGIVVVEVTGRVTMGRDAQSLEWALADLVEKKNEKRILVNLTGVPYIDSTGVGILALYAGKAKQGGGALRQFGAAVIIQEVLKITGMSAVLGLHKTQEDAAA